MNTLHRIYRAIMAIALGQTKTTVLIGNCIQIYKFSHE